MRVVIAGGGTGGHVFPAIAIAEAAKERFPEAEVVFVGTPRGIETTVIPAAGWRLEVIDVMPLKGRSVFERLVGIGKMMGALFMARKILKRLRPNLVIGVGGYASAAICLTAVITGIPTMIHEQNSIPGFTNRLLGRVVKKVCITFPESARYFPAGKVVVTGNPVRQSVMEKLTQLNKNQPHSFVVFIFGGSQGARSLNQGMIAALPYLKGLSRPLRVIHQVGAHADEAAIFRAYQAAGIPAEVHRFIRDMGRYYRQADVVVGRAGASTLSELALVGRPTILVPYPFAADNHQEFNARAFVSAGAARMILDRELDGPRLAGELRGLLEDHTSRPAMAACMKRLATPNAAADIVREGTGLMNV